MKLLDTDSVIRELTDGKVGVFPTDTAFGIGCRMDRADSIQKVFDIRKRPENKPLLILVGSIEMAQKYLLPISDEVQQNLIEKYWPGGLTLILRCNRVLVPEIVRSKGSTLALRMPDHAELLKVISGVGVPIVAPSANIAGGQTPFTLAEVDEKLLSSVDFIMEGECTVKNHSTIIDCSVTPWKIVREGAVKINDELITHNFLFIDTSDSEKISVRLVKNTKEFVQEAKREKKSQVTLELIQHVLKESNTKLEDINKLYVKEGPGSYTGLKVGASIANALSFVLHIPVNDLPLGSITTPEY